jgi:hypothetical protein
LILKGKNVRLQIHRFQWLAAKLLIPLAKKNGG